MATPSPRPWLGIFITALLCWGAPDTPAQAYERASVGGKKEKFLFWKERTITWYMDAQGCDNVNLSEAVGAAKRAFFAWASPSCTDIYFNYGGVRQGAVSSIQLSDLSKADLKPTITWHRTWPPKPCPDCTVDVDTISQTTLVYDQEGVIVDADIDLNGQSAYWTVTEEAQNNGYDIQSVLAIEVGHLLGLSRSGILEAVMAGDLKLGAMKRQLHDDDEAGVCWIYPFEGRTPTGAGQTITPPKVTGAAGCALVGAPSARVRGLWPLGIVLLVGLLRRRR